MTSLPQLSVYNTLSRKKEPLTPLEAGKIKMYVCGVTVYDLCHLGHARVMVVFDMITRYLRERGYEVTYVRNITDIDDKILKRADENGEEISQLTERMITAMHEDEARLGVLRPDIEPRATAHIEDILNLIKTLEDKGYAYAAENGDVYYRVRKFEGYGQLTNRKLDELQAGSRVEVDSFKEDPLDFVLWKAAKPGEASWPSPWGDGRPGWHIECSAMSTCCLGNTFDIHGGGPDLPFPHHENEIAQSEAATGQKYVNTWMHAGAVRVDEEKMSKSLGNFFTIREILEAHDPEVVRYLLLSSHYRSAINYADTALKDARKSLERFYTALDGIETVVYPQRVNEQGQWRQDFYAAMDDDFNTPEALAVLFDLTRAVNRAREGEDTQLAAALAGELQELGAILGLLQQEPKDFLQGQTEAASINPDVIETLIEKRLMAKQERNFAEADRIRDDLAAQGIILKDSKDGTTWTRA
ncbi:cysteinyl-tRNA synthetase [Marinospirillum celere]|uniref:Cysteine--tRNA ligase n=1 Tax=Marinospirillum celere TaxID=1122252 RepID=A0A1I1DRX7_9GAMM|nr:cysteine--tRNA ligase [Marinospirillum celere]SFB77604.1 cysteinyl-tRNA synthetase [Marinospirillum celere]